MDGRNKSGHDDQRTDLELLKQPDHLRISIAAIASLTTRSRTITGTCARTAPSNGVSWIAASLRSSR